MDRYGYVLKRKGERQEPAGRYHRSDLLLMTTYQLKEICRTEKIIQGVVNPMDKEELIRVILRYRGAEEHLLIKEAAGLEALERLVGKCRFVEGQETGIKCSSKIIAWEGLALGFYDGLTIPYAEELAGTNALVIGGDGTVCTILNVEAKGRERKALYLTKAAGIPCRESGVKDYSLCCMSRRNSEILYRICRGEQTYLPERMEVYRIPLLDFQVRRPVPLSLPLAMDFGTANTTAGVYLDSLYFEAMGLQDGTNGLKSNEVNYALFYDTSSDWEETALLPSVVGVLSAEPGENRFSFGHEAVRLANASFLDEGFCIFYDIKRWIVDYDREEEITDRQGRRGFVKRKDILKAYFTYVIEEACNRFKCEVGAVHVSCPVKQKARFQRLFEEILPACSLEKKDMIDEGVCVLYSTLSEMIRKGQASDGREYRALVIDCGGGTTDLCSCSFRIWDRRVSYRIEIDTSYENGDTDFGGNNLTYRILQFLKILAADTLQGRGNARGKALLQGFEGDIYRAVDERGTTALYQDLEEAYAEAEQFFPTRFMDYGHRSRADYFKAKNNFYFLFQAAEKVKKEFYSHADTIRIALSSLPVKENATTWIPADKWRVSVERGGHLETLKEFPQVCLTVHELELLLKADIYGILRRFMAELYESGRVEEYSIIRLTGQSCKIDLFRDALKEFVPGRTIQFKKRSGDGTPDFGLKMTCVEGALRYLRDKKYGFADITIRTGEPALPYYVTAFTHSGEEMTLIHCLRKSSGCGMISRNMEDLVLKLYLKDMDGRERYQYTCHSVLSDFQEMEYEGIARIYGEQIRQADTDDIVDREVKFFVWARPEEWSFVVVPVYRKEERLYLGREEEFHFENDGWVQNFFNGLK
ncbi:MAG: molecular chaperone [Kineothrix sp.]